METVVCHMVNDVSPCCSKSHLMVYNLQKIETRLLTMISVKTLVCGIASALDYLHVKWKFVHNNVAAYNIFLCPSGGVDRNDIHKLISDSLFGNKPICEVVFKLGGFENATPHENDHHFNADVQDLATVAADAVRREILSLY